MGFAKQYKKQKDKLVVGNKRTSPVTQEEVAEANDLEAKRLSDLANKQNTLWGPGTPFSTQAEYQRACLGTKYNQK